MFPESLDFFCSIWRWANGKDLKRGRPTSVRGEAKTSLQLRKVMADLWSVNAKMESSFDKTAIIAFSTLISSAAAISYKLVVASSTSWSSSVVLKESLQQSLHAFVTSVSQMDEWDFRLEISEIHLNCRVRNSPCDVPNEVFWHLILLIYTPQVFAWNTTLMAFCLISMECGGPWNRKRLRRGSRVWSFDNVAFWQSKCLRMRWIKSKFACAHYTFSQIAMHE